MADNLVNLLLSASSFPDRSLHAQRSTPIALDVNDRFTGTQVGVQMIAQFVAVSYYTLEQDLVLIILEHRPQHKENSFFVVFFKKAQHLTVVTVVRRVINGKDDWWGDK